MDEATQRRVAANESSFRDLNESIERGRWPGDEHVPAAFRCECAQLGCSQMLELTIREYEHVRAHPRRFLVAVDHHLPGVEDVVETFENYLVVEKRGEAGAFAQATDPRD